MRTLELRLEEWSYGWDDGKLTAWESPRTPSAPPRTNGEYARLQAALEFFDRAYSLGCWTNERNPPEEMARFAFQAAAARTLLRFGVRIVGLEEAAHA